MSKLKHNGNRTISDPGRGSEPARPSSVGAGDEAFRAVARQHGVALTADQGRRLVRFSELLFTWNERINLVGFGGIEALAQEHFPDSLVAAPFVRPGAAVVDVGSGGGLPALPLALLVPNARYTLVEPVAKKAAFLRTAVRELGLRESVAISTDRVLRPPAPEMKARFDVALARAVFSPEDWLDLGLELIQPEGQVLVFTTPEAAPGVREKAPRVVAEVSYRRSRALVVAGERKDSA